MGAVVRTAWFRAALRYAPPFAISLVTAELFFEFHSFTLECLAFLALWKGLDWVAARMTGDGTASLRPPGF